MKIHNPLPSPQRLPVIDPSGEDRPKLASAIVDTMETKGEKGVREHHRVQYAWDKDLEQNVLQVVDNRTGEVINKALTDAQRDHLLRVRGLVGLHVDEEG